MSDLGFGCVKTPNSPDFSTNPSNLKNSEPAKWVRRTHRRVTEAVSATQIGFGSEAHAANQLGDRAQVNAKIAEYRTLYAHNREHLK